MFVTVGVLKEWLSRNAGFRFALPILVLLGFTWPVRAQWTTVGDGIEYQKFTAPGPNNLFVSRMLRSKTNAIIDTSIALDMMAGAKERVRYQAAREDDAISWWDGSWGRRNDVIVAINGGFYDTSTGEIDGGQIKGGWYAHWFPDRGAFSGFAWKTDRTAFHGECVDHTDANVRVRFVVTGANQPINGVNRAPGNNDLVIFTPQYASQTPSGTRTEVLVEMSRPNLTTSGGGYSSGIIRSVLQNTGSTWIPFDHLVLSADGSAGTTLKNNATTGAEVRIYQELVESNEPTVQGEGACQTATGVNWANVFAAINSNYHFLKNNVVRVPDAVAHPGYQGYVNLNPRTAICWNSTYVFFVVCDGRSSQSVGMSCETLGNWAKNTLGATDGVNLDGGGSSTMVVNGVVKNRPSDGSERAVCNGVMMVNVLPKVLSTTFSAGQNVRTTVSANLRLGPGSNYSTFAALSSGVQGTILSHSVNGVYAKGSYWWKCDFNGTTGWIADSLLASVPTPPFITQQPSSQSVVASGNANFTVEAAGSSPLGYRWQRNLVNLSDGGNYSGCTTATLTITGVNSNNTGSYRCVVTNAYGNTNSGAATLTLIPPKPCVGLLNSDFEGGFSLGGGGYLADGWAEWEAEPDVVIGYDETDIVHGGGHAQRIRVWGDTNGSSGGVYQRIPIATGQPFTARVWAYSGDHVTACSLGVDPAGGTNGTVGVNWSPATTNVAWIQHTIVGDASADYITVYYKVATSDNNKHNGYFDDGSPAATKGALQLAAYRKGNMLTLTWPACPGAQLERAVSLTPPLFWNTVTNTVSVAADQKSVNLTPSESTGFFRLVLE